MFFGNYSSGVGDDAMAAAAAALVQTGKLAEAAANPGQTQAQRDVANGNTHYMHDNQLNMDFPMQAFWVAPVARAIWTIPSNKEPLVASIRPILAAFKNPPPMPNGGGLGITLKQYGIANQTINDIMAYGAANGAQAARAYVQTLYAGPVAPPKKSLLLTSGRLITLAAPTSSFPWAYAVGGLAVVGGAAYFLLFRK